MFGTTFYHGTTKKLIIAFGSVFNNIHVEHKEADGTVLKDIKVPLAYESRKKYLAKLIQDSKKNRQVPRMGFVLPEINLNHREIFGHCLETCDPAIDPFIETERTDILEAIVRDDVRYPSWVIAH